VRACRSVRTYRFEEATRELTRSVHHPGSYRREAVKTSPSRAYLQTVMQEDHPPSHRVAEFSSIFLRWCDGSWGCFSVAWWEA
jgi:hypothetical protein